MLHRSRRRPIALLTVLLLVAASCTRRPATIWLDELHMALYNESVSSVTVLKPGEGSVLKIGSRAFHRGIGLRSVGVVPFYLEGHARRFTAWVGAADSVRNDNPVRFFVLGDRKVLFSSPVLKGGDAPVRVKVNLQGVQRMGLLVVPVQQGGRRVLSWWADASLRMVPDDTPRRIPHTAKPYILTPPAPPGPRITGARVTGTTPGHPFLWRIPATGRRPMRFAASGLPAGLSLDTASGIISGSVRRKGRYKVTLVASNRLGADTAELLLSAEGRLALTPPMGWNGWNAWVRTLDRDKVMASVRALVTSGLINHGWTYINLDDTWEGSRGGPYHGIQPNTKFPRFAGMVDSLHALGLKMGVYGTPWICTYAGFPGSTSDNPGGAFSHKITKHKRAYHYIGKYSFEKNDAQQMAAWGIDYLKYDWHMRDPAEAATMLHALRNSGRDILFSLSNHAPLSHAAGWARTGNLYRTGPDIRDSWTSLEVSGFGSGAWAPYGGPGHWNDPDMLVIGDISTGAPLHPTRLTPDEQYTQVSLWSLLSAPLIIGCPLERLDSFTLNLLDNDEVLAVDQDPLGKPAVRISDTAGSQIWVKHLQDGSLAVGLFHTGNWGSTPQSYFSWGDEQPATITVNWKQLQIEGRYRIRDLWRQKDLGVSDSGFRRLVPFHGVLLVRLTPAKAPNPLHPQIK